MVIETFRGDTLTRAGARFRQKGRMLPEGVVYEASWRDEAGTPFR